MDIHVRALVRAAAAKSLDLARIVLNVKTPDDPPEVTPQLYITAPYPCSYLDGRQAQSCVATPVQEIKAGLYSALVSQGFRRSGLFTYRPGCAGCSACIPLRVLVADFKANRSQQRAWRQHKALEARILPLSFSAEHYALYRLYQSSRHPGGGMDLDNEDQYIQFLLQSQVETRMVEFREPGPTPGAPGQLCMVAIIDLVSDGLSAAYTFFEPRPAASFGTYGILWQIQQTKQMGLAHVYLGYWIELSQKMAYKSQFRPHQRWIAAQWRDYNSV